MAQQFDNSKIAQIVNNSYRTNIWTSKSLNVLHAMETLLEPKNQLKKIPGALMLATLRERRLNKLDMDPALRARVKQEMGKKRKAVIKAIYNNVTSIKSANDPRLSRLTVLHPIILNNKNTTNLIRYTKQRVSRLHGRKSAGFWNPVSRLNPSWNIKNPKSRSTIHIIPEPPSSLNLVTRQRYNIWNPNGTPPSRQVMNNLRKLWNVEKKLGLNHEAPWGSLKPQISYEQAKKILNTVVNKNSIVYKNIVREIKERRNFNNKKRHNSALSRMDNLVNNSPALHRLLAVHGASIKRNIVGHPREAEILNKLEKLTVKAINDIVKRANPQSEVSVKLSIENMRRIGGPYANQKIKELMGIRNNSLTKNVNYAYAPAVAMAIQRIKQVGGPLANQRIKEVRTKQLNAIAAKVNPENAISVQSAIRNIKAVGGPMANQKVREIQSKQLNALAKNIKFDNNFSFNSRIRSIRNSGVQGAAQKIQELQNKRLNLISSLQVPVSGFAFKAILEQLRKSGQGRKAADVEKKYINATFNKALRTENRNAREKIARSIRNIGSNYAKQRSADFIVANSHVEGTLKLAHLYAMKTNYARRKASEVINQIVAKEVAGLPNHLRASEANKKRKEYIQLYAS